MCVVIAVARRKPFKRIMANSDAMYVSRCASNAKAKHGNVLNVNTSVNQTTVPCYPPKYCNICGQTYKCGKKSHKCAPIVCGEHLLHTSLDHKCYRRPRYHGYTFVAHRLITIYC